MIVAENQYEVVSELQATEKEYEDLDGLQMTGVVSIHEEQESPSNGNIPGQEEYARAKRGGRRQLELQTSSIGNSEKEEKEEEEEEDEDEEYSDIAFL